MYPVLSKLNQRYRIYYEELGEHMPGLLKDREMYQELRGASYTRLYVYGEKLLAISVESGRMYESLMRQIPKAKRKTFCVITFPISSLAKAAEAMRAKKRRQVTAAMRERGKALAKEHPRNK